MLQKMNQLSVSSDVNGILLLTSRTNIQRLGKWGEKHEIYAVAFDGHHFCDLFLQGRGRGATIALSPSQPLPIGSVTDILVLKFRMAVDTRHN